MPPGNVAETGWRLFCIFTGMYLAVFGAYAVVTRRMPRGVSHVHGNPPPLSGRAAVLSGIAFLGVAGVLFWWALR